MNILNQDIAYLDLNLLEIIDKVFEVLALLGALASDELTIELLQSGLLLFLLGLRDLGEHFGGLSSLLLRVLHNQPHRVYDQFQRG